MKSSSRKTGNNENRSEETNRKKKITKVSAETSTESEHNPGDELGKKVSRSEETIRKARKQECGDTKGSSIEETNKER